MFETKNRKRTDWKTGKPKNEFETAEVNKFQIHFSFF